LKFKERFNIIFGLQFSQIMRFVTFLIISSLFTKQNLTHLTKSEIGDFELLTMITGALSFFWVTGIIQTFLPLYNNNSTFKKRADIHERSPEIFNTFLLLLFFSISFALLLFAFQNKIYVYQDLRNFPHINLLVIYFILSNVTPLIEYIYYVRNRPFQIVNYVFLTSMAQLVLVIGPALLDWGLEMCIIGLIAINLIRFIWLLVLLQRYAEFTFSFAYIRTHVKLGLPLFASCLLSGSSQYIDGFIATWTSDASRFAVFRYGLKEMPFVSSMANGLSTAMLTEFSTAEKMRRAMYELKRKSAKLMHYLFPLSIVVMVFSKWIYNHLFTQEFNRSADIFMVYLLMIISRLVFPQTILIGMKRTKIFFWTSLVVIVSNIFLSLYLANDYNNGALGLVGIALGTVIVHVFEKIFLIIYNYYMFGITPRQYIPVGWFLFYSTLITLVFALIDHRLLFYT
jgi:O-antigen/teichoic acid export membrane protein